MRDPVTLMTAAAHAASTVIGITRQVQRAQAQQANYGFLAVQQHAQAAADEQRARFAEQQGEADVDAARQKTAQQLGTAQARLAAQGTDLLGSPLDVLGDLAASGEEDVLSLRHHAMRNAWENRVRGAARQAEARQYEAQAGRVDPTRGSYGHCCREVLTPPHSYGEVARSAGGVMPPEDPLDTGSHHLRQPDSRHGRQSIV